MQLRDLEQYESSASFAGATLGPSVGRVPGGVLSLDGQWVQLSQNEGVNHLHGGVHNFSRMEWDVLETGSDTQAAWVVFGITVRDGLDGYPGFRHVTVRYTLDEQNSLSIVYRAKTDKPTFMVLSNHVYWNLSGNFAGDIYDHRLHIAARQVWHNDEDHLPQRLARVEHSPFDFRAPDAIGGRMARYPEDAQLKNGRGYNNAYRLEGDPAAVLEHPDSGRRLVLTTDYPALVFYSGGYLGGETLLSDNLAAGAGCALALEPQEQPLLLHTPCPSPPVLRPGEAWQRRICYSFGTV